TESIYRKQPSAGYRSVGDDLEYHIGDGWGAVCNVKATMNLLSNLENGLFALGQVLRFPVMSLLWVCVACALFMVGSCLMDFLARQRERRAFDLRAWLKQGPVLTADGERRTALPPDLRNLLVEAQQSRNDLGDGGLEHIVLKREERVRGRLSGSRTL